MTNENHNISTTRVATAIKLGSMLTFFKRLPPIKLIEPLKLLDYLKQLHLYCYSAYDNQTCQLGDFSDRVPIVIVTWTFNHLVFIDYVTN